jgi:hypothetical protein
MWTQLRSLQWSTSLIWNRPVQWATMTRSKEIRPDASEHRVRFDPWFSTHGLIQAKNRQPNVRKPKKRNKPSRPDPSICRVGLELIGFGPTHNWSGLIWHTDTSAAKGPKSINSGLNSCKLLSMLMETVVRMAILKVNYNHLHLTNNKWNQI